ncbi:hypothetical protein LRP30_31715 [Bradyrhizobium sp. C-145]|nr:hypothetical protein [Bradyrhizobium sp. C-145]UQR61443.1 hypothetical protein LRP30_31715 [Bradyrhizobium sp. C-145]
MTEAADEPVQGAHDFRRASRSSPVPPVGSALPAAMSFYGEVQRSSALT